MTFRRWCAGLAATAGLAGSLLVDAPAAVAADAGARAADRPVAQRVLAPPPGDRTTDETERRKPAAGTGSEGRRTTCLGLVPSPYPYAHTPYVCNDWRFGPAKLPTTGVLGRTLVGYHRFGTLTPVEFLNKWWNPNKDHGLGDWRYELIPDDGFDHDAAGAPIATEVTLQPGRLLDRFGNEFGKFLSPAGSTYAQRSIPPSGLDTQDPRFPYNYHLYRVKKPTLVCAGPTAPAFEQPGLGTQYVTSVTKGAPYCKGVQAGATVSSLLADENLVRAN